LVTSDHKTQHLG